MAYTTINDPSAQFQIALYSGNGGGTNNVVNDGNSNLQPDWVWVKERSSTSSHALTNSTAGAGYILSSNNNNAQSSAGAFSSFNSDGFTVGSDGKTNESGQTYVGWQWKANGGTTATNNDGSHTSTVQANTTAGFSIVTYTGTGSGFTLGHGLGAAPEIIFNKGLSDSHSWIVGCTHDSANLSKVMILNSSDASATATANFNAAPTSSVYTIGTAGGVNNNGQNYVSYLFRSVQGYSKIGVYTGNGNDDGPFVYTGFKPAFLMAKKTSGTGTWFMWDDKRSPINVINIRVLADTNAGDDTSNDNRIDFLSNGFKIRDNSTSFNDNNSSMFFMAFAENPLVASNDVIALAR